MSLYRSQVGPPFVQLSKKHKGDRRWSVPKHTLISNLDALINTGELRIAAELLEASAAKDELKNLRRHVTNAGRATFSAPSGSHDDLVVSLGLACWWCTQVSRMRVSVGFVRGLY